MSFWTHCRRRIIDAAYRCASAVAVNTRGSERVVRMSAAPRSNPPARPGDRVRVYNSRDVVDGAIGTVLGVNDQGWLGVHLSISGANPHGQGGERSLPA